MRSIGGIAKQFLQSVETPTAGTDLELAGAVSDAIFVLSKLGPDYIPHESMDPFHERWFEFARRDFAASGAFGKDAFEQEVIRRANYLLMRGKNEQLLSLLDAESRSVRGFSDQTQFGLQRLCSDAHRITGRFGTALSELTTAKELAAALGPEDQFAVQVLSVKLECDLGRLEEARNALREMSRLFDEMDANERPRFQRQLAVSRCGWFLADNENASALRLARAEIKKLGSVEPNVVREVDILRTFAFVAEARIRNASQRPGAARASLTAEAEKLLRSPYLDAIPRSLIELERIALLAGSGDIEGATTQLSALASNERELLATSPLFGCRFAVRRFELAQQSASVEERICAAAAMTEAFERLIEAWHRTDLQSSGIGFLSYRERRRAFHLALLGTLAQAENDPAAGVRRALELTLFVEAQSTVAKRLGADAISAESVVRLAREASTTIVQLVPTPDGTHRFVVDASGIRHDVLEHENEFTRRFAEIASSLRQRPLKGALWPQADVQQDIDWLSKRLVPTAAQRVCYSGLSSVGLAPVEVLEERTGEPIGLTRVVYRAPSIVSLFGLRRAFEGMATGHGDALRLFALSGEVNGRARLDVTVAEDAILRATSGNRLRATQGRSATTEGFHRALASGSALFVAWTHGEYAGNGTAAPRLVVQQGAGQRTESTLTPSSVELALSRTTAAERPLVAILAACNAKAGPRRRGDAGSSDFSGAFMGGAVPVLISSPEEIERYSAMQFLLGFSEAFYQESSTAGEAVLHARRRVAAQPGMDHPHFWAPLQLAGWADAELRTK